LSVFKKTVLKTVQNRSGVIRKRLNVQIEARVRHHGEMTVTGVPVRRALVAKGFRGRPSLWVIFPKILCGVLGVRRTGENSIHRVRTSVRIASHHVQLVMSCHVGVKS